MFRSLFTGAILLVLAATVPALYYSSTDLWKKVRAKWDSTPAAVSVPVSEPGQPPVKPATPAAASEVALEGPPPTSLAEVLRFDVTRDWVFRRWPRVSTGLAQLPLQGYRVPLVTGTAESDLAGSLTYYFSPQHEVQRLTFHGTTGDPRKLITLLADKYHFAHRMTNNPGLFVYESVSASGRNGGVLKILPSEVIKASNPCRRFEVELWMDRPS